MRFIFYSPVAFEKWDWRNSVEKGIGGSETSHVEMSWRLAKRGHEVITYAPIPDDCSGQWRGTKWYPIEKADFTQPGIWILYRCPETVDKFMPKRKDQKLWLMMQDWDYPDWTDERIKALDKVITLCKAHGRYIIEKHPLIEKNIWLSSNGVKTDLIDEVESEGLPERNPKRIMYASSPDRGLKQALIIFKKAREYVPDLELHVFYGFNNLNKLIGKDKKSRLAKIRTEILDLTRQPGVVMHGRVSQKELYQEWFKTGIMLYCTSFFETSWITGQEAQAMGAIPVFSPVFAQAENAKHGVAVEGHPDDPLTHSRFAAEIVRLTDIQPELQNKIRPEMMEWARRRFDWENFVTQWELEAEDKRKEFQERFGFPIQL